MGNCKRNRCYQMVRTFEARILPSRLMTGTPRYTAVAHDPVRHIRNVSARNLTHGVNDPDRERGFLEHVIRVFKNRL